MSVSLHLGTAVGFVVVIYGVVAIVHIIAVLAEQMAMGCTLLLRLSISVVTDAESRLLWQSPMEPHTFLAPYLPHGGSGFLDALLETLGTQSVFVRLSRHERAGDGMLFRRATPVRQSAVSPGVPGMRFCPALVQ